MRVLVTGSNGLVGSETATYFDGLGAEVIGVDNNMRAFFFGPAGDTRATQRHLEATLRRFRHRELDVRDRAGMLRLVQEVQPDVVVHCAAQPSADLAARLPFEDFEINVHGTMHLLEAVRRYAPDAVVVHMSSARVYGDAPNGRPLRELETRWDFASPVDACGVDETCRVDHCTHGLGGATALAADVLAQEYGRSFGLRVGVFRLGSVTGPGYPGVEPHGFLSYLTKAAATGLTCRIHGGRAKQVRDVLHAHDVARAVHAFVDAPRPGEVYNLGGGRANSCSVVEAIALTRQQGGGALTAECADRSRPGDPLCYISDTRKFTSHHPAWHVATPLPEIVRQLVTAWSSRQPYSLPKAG